MLCIHHSIFTCVLIRSHIIFAHPTPPRAPPLGSSAHRGRDRARAAARTAPGAARHGRGSDIIYAHVSRPSASFSCLRR